MKNHTTVDLNLVLDYFNFKYEIKGKERLICCPFHKEKTPSLYANKNTFNCFGCGVKGNAISFIAQYRGIDNLEAFKFYCEIAGINYSSTLENKQIDDKFYDNLTVPEKILRSSVLLEEPTEYLKKRGISTIKSKTIYILQKDFICTYQNEEIKIYKNAYIIPIYSKNNELKSIQYITPNNTKHFLKGHVLKGGYCPFIINSDERFFLVEGVWDALSLNVVGINAICCFNKDNLVASSLDNFDNWVYKGYVFADNDPQGIDKAHKSSSILHTAVLKSPVNELKDVNDILKDQGEKYLQKLISDFLQGYYLSTLSSLIKAKQLKLFYNKFDDKYIAYLFEDVLQHQSKTSLGYQVLNKLQNQRIVFIKSTDAEIVAKEIGKFISLNCIMVTDINYHPKYHYYETYKEFDNVYLNTYRQSGLHASKNLVKKPFPHLWKHLIHICSGNESYAKWFIELLAWKWQQPWVKYEYLPILHGTEGTGKGRVAEILALLFGDNTNKDLTDLDFEEKFNSAFENKLIVIADEVITADNRLKAHAKIKAITGSTTFSLENKRIRKKNNYGNYNTIILMSNHEYVYPIGEDDRRAVVFKQLEKLDSTHYKIMHDMVKGIAHTEELIGFAYHLANLPLKDRLEQLKTSGRKDLIELSKSFVEEFVDDLSNDCENIIREINHMYKTEFPIMDSWDKEKYLNGFYISQQTEKKQLYISTNMFLSMINKKYSQSAKNNRFIYSMARKNKKFSYELNNDFITSYNRKAIRIIKIQLD